MANTARQRIGTYVLRRWERTFMDVGSKGPTRKALQGIGALVATSTIERMEKAVTPAGKAHKPLSAEYVARKTARRKVTSASGKARTVKGYSAEIWQRTGESKRKVQTKNVTRKSVIVVINTPWSGWADSDGRVPRQVLGTSREDREAIERILTRDLGEQIDRGI